jgi:hypothetical protein
MREWQCGDAISSNAVDVVHGDAGDGDGHSENTDGHKGEEDNTEHGECGTGDEDHTGDGHGDTGGKEDHTEHGQGDKGGEDHEHGKGGKGGKDHTKHGDGGKGTKGHTEHGDGGKGDKDITEHVDVDKGGTDHTKHGDGGKGTKDHTEHGDGGKGGKDHTEHGDVGKDGKDHTEHGDGGQGGMTGGGCNVRKLQSPPLMQSPPLNQQPPPTKKHVREYIVPAKAKRARLQSPKKVMGKGSKEHEHGGDVQDVGKGGKEQHDEHGGGTWVGGGWSQAAYDGDGWSQAAGDSDDRWHEATYKGDTEQQDHVSHSWYDVHNSCKEEKEHGGEGCTGGTGWESDDWGPQWPHSGDDTWMGDQYDGGCWCMQRGSYIGR